jgi:hypothetical protein
MGVPGFRRLVEALPRTDRSVRLLFHQLGHREKLLDGRISREDLACYAALMAHTDTLRNEFAPARALISPVRGLARLHLPDDILKGVACPTLFIWGGRDPFGGAAVGRALVERIPTASLDLMADAGHNLSDVLGLVLAWTAVVVARRSPNERFTYGLRSSSILAALANAMLLLVACGAIGWEAVQRFSQPPAVASVTVRSSPCRHSGPLNSLCSGTQNRREYGYVLEDKK